MKEENNLDLFCFKCSLQFNEKTWFDLHYSLVHENAIETNLGSTLLESEPKVTKLQSESKGKFKCHSCQASFTRNFNLKYHIYSVHERKKPSFSCNLCGAKIRRKNYLKVHIASVHEGKKPFNCPVCSTNFSRKIYLKGHINSVHEKKKPFKCKICDLGFARKGALITHKDNEHKGKSILNENSQLESAVQLTKLCENDLSNVLCRATEKISTI